ncbi:hypothetical protein [Phytomonospora endophytica]|uniref:DUF11 domain-containing protein n=1 Tax=Phytomonospora endophytica TaxID=714109 RepID=A0A841G2L0_9ACTN|nr:hypothetical protein [Phytomonospora endophytica]MBB6038939.1 hypothetical protein [Phytomonospora endophytica]GIG67959.1 hypothetical protein Pen01_42540 [Phytomonospora endophytica]
MKRAARLAAACAILLPAAPAFAGDLDDARLGLAEDPIRVSAASGTTSHDILWSLTGYRSEGVTTGFTFTVDASGVDGLAGFTLGDLQGEGPDVCDHDGFVWTCVVGDLHYESWPPRSWSAWQPQLLITADPAVNGTGELVVTIAADGLKPATVTRALTVGDETALTLDEPPAVAGAPGDVVELAVGVTNTGDATVHNPRLRLSADGAAPAAPGHSNCVTDASEYRVETVCAFPVTLTPGEHRSLTLNYRIRADSYATGAGNPPLKPFFRADRAGSGPPPVRRRRGVDG